MEERHERGRRRERRKTFSRMRPHALREHRRLARLGVVALHHPHAPERLGEASGDLGVDLAALAEDRPQRRRRPGRARGRRRPRDTRVSAVMPGLRCSMTARARRRGEQAAGQLHEAGADEVPDALDVVHDPRDELAGLVGVVVGDRQPADVRLHLASRISAMSRCAALESSWVSAKEVSALHQGGRHHRPAPAAAAGRSARCPMTSSTRNFVEAGQHQAGHAVDGHEHEADGSRRAAADAPAPRRPAGAPAAARTSVPGRDSREVPVATRAAPLTSAFYRAEADGGPARPRGARCCVRAGFGALRRSLPPSADPRRGRSAARRPQRTQATADRSSRCRNLRPQRHPIRRATKWRVARWRRILIAPAVRKSHTRRCPLNMLDLLGVSDFAPPLAVRAPAGAPAQRLRARLRITLLPAAIAPAVGSLGWPYRAIRTA